MCTHIRLFQKSVFRYILSTNKNTTTATVTAWYTPLQFLNKMSGEKQDRKLHMDSSSNDISDTFQGIVDRFKGVTVESKREKCDSAVFPIKIEASLNAWKKNGIRGVWFKVYLEDADWIPILVKNKFVFHHAKPEYVTLCLWLPEGEPCNVPQYAHTMVGVGAVVVNSAGEVLVVREKYYADIPHWKLPGGYVEPGEDLEEAAKREVLEETSIETEFQFLVTFRHIHGFQFQCSDFYFIVALKPKSEDIVMCTREIAACQWMKIEEYLSSQYVFETSKLIVQHYLECRKSGSVISCKSSVHPILKKRQSLYSIDNDNKYFSDFQENSDSPRKSSL